MPDNNDIRTNVTDAWDSFHNSHVAYLQALIFVSRAGVATESDGALLQSYLDLGRNTATFGMSQIEYFQANLFFSQVAGLEHFIQRAIRAAITVYPKKLGSATFSLIDIIDSDSIDELIHRAVDGYLNKVMYKKPFEYLKDICEVLSIPQERFATNWPNFIEAKARRDAGIHNNWICNDVYLRKIAEAGLAASVSAGDSLIPRDEQYIHAVTDELRNVGFTVLKSIHEKYA